MNPAAYIRDKELFRGPPLIAPPPVDIASQRCSSQIFFIFRSFVIIGPANSRPRSRVNSVAGFSLTTRRIVDINRNIVRPRSFLQFQRIKITHALYAFVYAFVVSQVHPLSRITDPSRSTRRSSLVEVKGYERRYGRLKGLSNLQLEYSSGTGFSCSKQNGTRIVIIVRDTRRRGERASRASFSKSERISGADTSVYMCVCVCPVFMHAGVNERATSKVTRQKGRTRIATQFRVAKRVQVTRLQAPVRTARIYYSGRM